MAAATLSFGARSIEPAVGGISRRQEQAVIPDDNLQGLVPQHPGSLSISARRIPEEQAKNVSGIESIAFASRAGGTQTKQSGSLDEDHPTSVQSIPPSYVQAQLEQLLRCIQPLSIYASIAQPSLDTSSLRTLGGDSEADADLISTLAISSSATAVDPFEVQLEEIKRPVRETGQWLFEKPAYKDWRGPDPRSNVLLLLAGPGLGKTILARHITEELSKNLGPGKVLAFFCKANIIERETATSIIASFLYKLLRSNYDKLLSQEFRLSLRADSALVQHLVGDKHIKRDSISFDVLWTLFLELSIGLCREDLVFIVDGLNECTPKARHELQKALITSRNKLKFSFLITSQPTLMSNELQEAFLTVTITETDLVQDLRNYVSHRLEDEGMKVEINKAAFEMISTAVTEQVNGMFLLVSCRVEEICRRYHNKELETNQAYINGIIQQPYAPVMQYFASMLTHAAREPLRVRSAALLNLLLAAQEPLYNTELVTAYALSNFKYETYQEFDEDNSKSTDLLFEAKNLFAPMLEIIHTRDATLVQLAHEQVRYFLNNEPEESFSEDLRTLLSNVNSEKGHALMAKACLTYLLYSEVCVNDREHFSNDPFCLYALNYWPQHVAKSGSSVSQCSKELAEFLSQETTGYGFWRVYKGVQAQNEKLGGIPLRLPIIHCLIRYGMIHVLDELITEPDTGTVKLFNCEIDLDELDTDNQTAVAVMIVRKDLSSAVKLLQLGASPNGLDPTSPSPLQLAAALRWPEAMRKLCAYKANVNEAAATGNFFPVLFYTIVGDKEAENEDEAKSADEDAKATLAFETLYSLGANQLVQDQHKYSVLHEAARDGNVALTRFILEKGLLDVNLRCADGSTPLIYAASAPNTHRAFEIVRYLVLSYDADLTIENDDGRSPLWEALRAENRTLAMFILDRMGISETEILDKQSSFAWNCLHCCAYAGFRDVAQELVRRKARLDLKTDLGRTALYLAIDRGHHDVARYLIEAGADVNSTDEDGDFPLYRACNLGQMDVVKALLRAGAKPLAMYDHISPLMIACWREHAAICDIILTSVDAETASALLEQRAGTNDWTAILIALNRKSVTIVRVLMAAGTSLQAKSASGWTALHYVGNCHDYDLFKAVLAQSQHAFLDQRTDTGMTALAVAALNGFPEAVAALLKQGADPTSLDDYSDTILRHAIKSESISTVKLILDDGRCSIDHRNKQSYTALHFAAQSLRERSLIRRLLTLTSQMHDLRSVSTPLMIAVVNDNKDMVDALIDFNADANTPSENGLTPLYAAKNHATEATVVRLIEHGADKETFSAYNVQPYVLAFHSATKNMISYLRPKLTVNLGRRADTNLSNAVLEASKSSFEEVVWLVENGVRPDVVSINGHTPLHAAAERGNLEILNYLIQLPSMKSILNHKHFMSHTTALIVATQARNPACIEALLENGEAELLHEDFFGLSAFSYSLRHQESLAVILRIVDPTILKGAIWKGKSPDQLRKIWLENLLGLIERLISLTESSDFTTSCGDFAHIVRLHALFLLSNLLLYLDDKDNALTALELCEGLPSAKFNNANFCYACKQMKRGRFAVCFICPGIQVCLQCRDDMVRLDDLGCSKHAFGSIPRDDWFQRRSQYVNDISQSEAEWMTSLKQTYQEKYADHCKKQNSTQASNIVNNIESWEYSDLGFDPFAMLQSGSLEDLREYLLKFPRSFTLKNELGNNLVMHAIVSATSDEQCLAHLEFLRFEGFHLLTRSQETTTVVLSCRKNFEKSTKYLLSQYDSSFNSKEDENSSEAMQHIIDSKWYGALEYAIERHFKWACRGSYDFLEDLNMMEWTDKMVVEFLKQNPLKTMLPSDMEKSRNTGIFLPFERTTATGIPQSDFHSDSCVHRLQTPRREIIEALPGSSPVAADPKISWEDILADFEKEDEDVADPVHLAKSETLSSISDTSSIMTKAAHLCGFGGIASDSDGSVNVITSDVRLLIVRLAYNTDKVSENAVSFALQVAHMAGNGLLEAMLLAQNAGICCSDFTVLHDPVKHEILSISAPDDNTTRDELALVTLSRIPFALVVDFVKEIEAAKMLIENHQEVHPTTISYHSASEIRGICAFPVKPANNTFASSLSFICQTMQFLCIAFLSFVGGHSSQIQLPVLSSYFPSTIICGTEDDGGVITVGPRQMACIGDMLGVELLVFGADITPTREENPPTAQYERLEEKNKVQGSVPSATDDMKPDLPDTLKPSDDNTSSKRISSFSQAFNLATTEGFQAQSRPALKEMELHSKFGSVTERYFILATLEDVLQIWGPGRCLFRSEHETEGAVVMVAIRQGYISLAPRTIEGFRVAHWCDAEIVEKEGYKWELPTIEEGVFADGNAFLRGDIDDQSSLKLLTFSQSETIAFGGLVRSGACRGRQEEIYTIAARKNRIQNMATNPEANSLKSQQASVTTGITAVHGGVNVGLQRVYERLDKDSKKSDILRQWRRSNKVIKKGGRWDPDSFTALKEPYGMLYSACSTFAIRVPLQVVIAEVWSDFASCHLGPEPPSEATKLFLDTMQALLDGRLPGNLGTTLTANADADAGADTDADAGADADADADTDADADFEQYISRRGRRTQLLVHSIILEILESLASSGVSRDGKVFKIAWVRPSDRIRGYVFRCTDVPEGWIRLMQDSPDVATFAIVTKDCLVEYKGYGTRCRNIGRDKVDVGEVSVLDTKVLLSPGSPQGALTTGFCCITTRAPRNSKHTRDMKVACYVKDRGSRGVDLVVMKRSWVLVRGYALLENNIAVTVQEYFLSLDLGNDFARAVYITGNEKWWCR